MDMVVEKLGYCPDNSGSKECLAWDTLERQALLQVENEWAREGTQDAETGLENIPVGLVMIAGLLEASHLADWLKIIFNLIFEENKGINGIL